MKNTLCFILLNFLLLACREEKKNPIDDLVQTNEKGVQENKVEELSVEDVERLMNSSENPSQRYTAILNNDIEKSYFVNSDTNQTVRFQISSKSDNVGLFVYKELMKTVKKDSTTSVKIKDFSLICEGDSCSDKSKKPMRYRAIVKLKRKFESKDSTAEFTLNIFKE